ncbi:hypothetical protein BLM37_02165 [Candidatus Gracilibacteria bacterium GN02-873]|nr:hypothetical protein BLM37_02165 [Candidatus Gracilibacteria bacterium GN02-873]
MANFFSKTGGRFPKITYNNFLSKIFKNTLQNFIFFLKKIFIANNCNNKPLCKAKIFLKKY